MTTNIELAEKMRCIYSDCIFEKDYKPSKAMRKALEAIRPIIEAEERERCARIAEDTPDTDGPNSFMRFKIVAAIRAGGHEDL